MLIQRIFNHLNPARQSRGGIRGNVPVQIKGIGPAAVKRVNAAAARRAYRSLTLPECKALHGTVRTAQSGIRKNKRLRRRLGFMQDPVLA